MKTAFKLAYRNLIGAGLRTWLNVIVLSFSFVVIIWMKGIMAGWDYQAKTDTANWQIGQGQYWHEQYDPYDPFTLTESHALVPEEFQSEIAAGTMEPMLKIQGTIYPEGRMQPVTINGMNPGQQVVMIPSHKMDTVVGGAVPAIMGALLSQNLHIEKGDRLILRWRDVNGMFDAAEIFIAEVFSSNVPAIESGQIYVPLEWLREMTMLQEEATIFTYTGEDQAPDKVGGWVHKRKAELTASIDELIKTKSAGQNVFYFILLLLAMLAVFDTQVMSVFRRQKEIGTYIALGYTRAGVVGLFTIEGAMHSVLAALVAAAYGFPFLAWQARVGWTLPVDANQFGMAMAQTLYPVYSAGLVLATVLIVVLVTTIVSYLPSRKIARMNPTEALRGRIQ